MKKNYGFDIKAKMTLSYFVEDAPSKAAALQAVKDLEAGETPEYRVERTHTARDEIYWSTAESLVDE